MSNDTMPYVLRFAVVFALIISVLSTALSYYIVSVDPSLFTFIAQGLNGALMCLFGGLAGLFVVRSYVKDTDAIVKVGNGAVVGLITGVIIAVTSGVIGILWQFIDPTLTERLMEATMNAVDSMGEMDTAQQEAMMDQMMANDPSKLSTQLTNMGAFAVILGILNMITGMIGSSIFSKKEEEL
jgi:hypothetical protein